MQRAGNNTQSEGRRLAETAIADMHALLATIPDGACVAVVSMLGSLCPITLGHVQGYVEARKLLLDQESAAARPEKLERFAECIGFVNLNNDLYVERKLRSKGQKALNIETRALLVRLATAEYPWLRFSESSSQGLPALRQRFPKLCFVEFTMNGADDVLKYRKWSAARAYNRMITMGRPGSTEAVLKGISTSKVAPENFILGPELPDISSTAARHASEQGHVDQLLTMLHPHVADYLLRGDGHEGIPLAMAAAENGGKAGASPGGNELTCGAEEIL